MSWLKPWDYTPPNPAKTSMADYMLGCAVLRDMLNADQNFLSGKMGPQYDNPDAYVANLVAYAVSLTQNRFAVPYAPKDWNPTLAAVQVAMDCFNTLAQLPVNVGDPDTVSVMQAWTSGKGTLAGGHDPVAPAAPGTPATGPTGSPNAQVSILSQAQV